MSEPWLQEPIPLQEYSIEEITSGMLLEIKNESIIDFLLTLVHVIVYFDNEDSFLDANDADPSSYNFKIDTKTKNSIDKAIGIIKNGSIADFAITSFRRIIVAEQYNTRTTIINKKNNANFYGHLFRVEYIVKQHKTLRGLAYIAIGVYKNSGSAVVRAIHPFTDNGELVGLTPPQQYPSFKNVDIVSLFNTSPNKLIDDHVSKSSIRGGGTIEGIRKTVKRRPVL